MCVRINVWVRARCDAILFIGDRSLYNDPTGATIHVRRNLGSTINYTAMTNATFQHDVCGNFKIVLYAYCVTHWLTIRAQSFWKLTISVHIILQHCVWQPIIIYHRTQATPVAWSDPSRLRRGIGHVVSWRRPNKRAQERYDITWII